MSGLLQPLIFGMEDPYQSPPDHGKRPGAPHDQYDDMLHPHPGESGDKLPCDQEHTRIHHKDGKNFLCVPLDDECTDDTKQKLRDASKVRPENVRWKIMDFDAENAPLYEQYLSEEDLWKCIEEALDDFNETPPMFRYDYTLADFPKKNTLLIGAALLAMKITVMKEIRREMQYDDGGISSSVYYKTPAYQQLVAGLDQEYQQSKQRIKRQINAERCYRGME